MTERKKRWKKRNFSVVLVIAVFVIALILFLKFNYSTGKSIFAYEGVELKVDSTYPDYEKVIFTSAKAGISKELSIIFDNDSSTTKIKPVLAYSSPSKTYTGETLSFLIHVKENERALRYDWIVLNKGDLGMIVRYTDFAGSSSSTGTLSLEDSITYTQQQITLTKSGNDYINNNAEIFGVSGYKIKASLEDNKFALYISWNSGTTSLFPRIKLANGGWIVFLQDTYILNGDNLILPNNKATLDSLGSVYSATGTTNQINDDGIVWLYDRATSGINHVWGIRTSSGTICNFSATRGPALLIVKSNYLICVPQTSKSVGSATYMDIGNAQISYLTNCLQICSGKSCGIFSACNCGTCSSGKFCSNGQCITYCKGNGFSCSNSNECCSKHCIQVTRGIWIKRTYSECG